MIQKSLRLLYQLTLNNLLSLYIQLESYTEAASLSRRPRLVSGTCTALVFDYINTRHAPSGGIGIDFEDD